MIDKKEQIRERITALIEEGKREFVIVPMGYWGGVTKQILNEEFGIQEKYCLDNNGYDGEAIFKVEEMPYVGECVCFLLAVENEGTYADLYKQLCKIVKGERIEDVFETQEISRIYHAPNKVQIDFLCAGFPKCGTTSLDGFLKRNKHIFLPWLKEPHFLEKISKQNHEFFKSLYSEDRKNEKLTGCMDISTCWSAKKVYKYFGADIKLIFCLRNPVQALFSAYKMHMRSGASLDIIEKYGITWEGFEKWILQGQALFSFADFIKQFLLYYPKEQMIFLISEEVFERPNVEMWKLQEFLGLSDDQKIDCESFPHINDGNKVSKNYLCASVNENVF